LLHLDEWFGVRLYNTANSYIFLRNPPPDKEQAFVRILGSVGDFQEICRQHQRELYVVIFPNRIQVENRESLSSSVYDAERPDRRILEYCEQHGLRCLDGLPGLSEAYARERRPLYYAVDRHLNESGTRVVTALIADWLERTRALGEDGSAPR